MNNLTDEYKEFLHNKFISLMLKKPLFYNWEFGLRFDLQDFNKIDTEEYFVEGIKRSIELFECIFDNSDRIYILYRIHKGYYGKNKKFYNKIFSEINEKECFEEANIYDEEDIYKTFIGKTIVSKINYEYIITAIENSDFGSRKPNMEGEIYFINIEKEIIYNMYDDRGIDIIGANKNSLKYIYEKYNNWLLECDRKTMDKKYK
jgi:hypothetical protein